MAGVLRVQLVRRSSSPLRWLLASMSSVLVLLFAFDAIALDVPPLQGHVNDHAQLLSDTQRQQLEQWLTNYERGTGNQFALLTVPSLEGDPIEDFSIRVVESWQLGSEQQDNGLLLLIVPKERKMRIEVGYGLEGAIPDALAGRIIRNVLAPAFRGGEYYAGIRDAFEALTKAAGGVAVEIAERQPARQTKLDRWTPWFFLLIMLLFTFGGRRRGFIWLGGLGHSRGGFRGGSFGGGGGFSGGGGGFGGGGASGGW